MFQLIAIFEDVMVRCVGNRSTYSIQHKCYGVEGKPTLCRVATKLEGTETTLSSSK